MEEKLGKPAPVVLAMVLCDAIYQDPATQKCTLLGTFSTINVRKFPATHRQLAVHVAMTDGYGQTRIKLTLAHADENKDPLFAQEGMIEFSNPRVVAELNFTVANLTFQAVEALGGRLDSRLFVASGYLDRGVPAPAG